MFSVIDGEESYQIFVLSWPLFGQAEKVLEAFREYHQIENNAPTGPPLEIPQMSARFASGGVTNTPLIDKTFSPKILPQHSFKKIKEMNSASPTENYVLNRPNVA